MMDQPTASFAAPALTALDTSASAHKHFRPAGSQSSHFGGAADITAAVQSPSLSSQSARARFEFEHGRGNEGTKVLMVEWEDDAVTRRIKGIWHVNWDGKPADVMPVEDRDVIDPHGAHGSKDAAIPSAVEDETYYSTTTTPATAHSDAPAVGGAGKHGKMATSHRLFFLLGPRFTVPATVTLTLVPDANANAAVVAPQIEWKTNPLPAIFPKSLAESSGSRSSKGVLHGIWAQKRLAKLAREIEQEAKSNCEGIALHMAISEKEWIETNYRLGPEESNNDSHSMQSTRSPLSLNTVAAPKSIAPAGSDAHSPLSPRTPGGSRIADKLKSLKLQTSDQPSSHPQPQPQPRMMPILPSPQPTSIGNASSIGAILSDSALAVPSLTTRLSQAAAHGSTAAPEPLDDEHDEQELFALPLSPRSPEMAMSPFSFAAADTRRYMNAGTVAGS